MCSQQPWLIRVCDCTSRAGLLGASGSPAEGPGPCPWSPLPRLGCPTRSRHPRTRERRNDRARPSAKSTRCGRACVRVERRGGRVHACAEAVGVTRRRRKHAASASLPCPRAAHVFVVTRERAWGAARSLFARAPPFPPPVSASSLPFLCSKSAEATRGRSPPTGPHFRPYPPSTCSSARP